MSNFTTDEIRRMTPEEQAYAFGYTQDVRAPAQTADSVRAMSPEQQAVSFGYKTDPMYDNSLQTSPFNRQSLRGDPQQKATIDRYLKRRTQAFSFNSKDEVTDAVQKGLVQPGDTLNFGGASIIWQ
jgi:hypothetical protein